MNEGHIAAATLRQDMTGFFRGTFACNVIPKLEDRPVSFIVNTDPAGSPGSHWVAIVLNTDGTGEYFDSFGFPPLEADIRNYLYSSCPKGFWYSSKTIQSVDAMSCGAWCVAFIRHRHSGRTLNDFLSGFTTDLTTNEAAIQYWNDVLFDSLLKARRYKRGQRGRS